MDARIKSGHDGVGGDESHLISAGKLNLLEVLRQLQALGLIV